MRNNKKECIFEHESFMYVINFELMHMWIVTHEDEVDPVSCLEIHRTDRGSWDFRGVGSLDSFMNDNDSELWAKIDSHYEQYLNRIIVGRDGAAKNQAKKIKAQRVPHASR